MNIELNTNRLISFMSEKFINGELDNNSLIQIIECAGSFLNLKTIPDYAKENSISYNGAKHFRCVKNILGVKFVVDNA